MDGQPAEGEDLRTGSRGTIASPIEGEYTASKYGLQP
jgi:hypothetical protein